MEYIAPIVPNIKNDMDVSNIDPVFLNENIESPSVKLKTYVDENLFKDF